MTTARPLTLPTILRIRALLQTGATAEQVLEQMGGDPGRARRAAAMATAEREAESDDLGKLLTELADRLAGPAGGGAAGEALERRLAALERTLALLTERIEHSAPSASRMSDSLSALVDILTALERRLQAAPSAGNSMEADFGGFLATIQGELRALRRDLGRRDGLAFTAGDGSDIAAIDILTRLHGALGASESTFAAAAAAADRLAERLAAQADPAHDQLDTLARRLQSFEAAVTVRLGALEAGIGERIDQLAARPAPPPPPPPPSQIDPALLGRLDGIDKKVAAAARAAEAGLERLSGGMVGGGDHGDRVDDLAAALATMSNGIGDQLKLLISRQETIGRFLQTMRPPAAAGTPAAAPAGKPAESKDGGKDGAAPRPPRPRRVVQPGEGDEMDRKMQEAMAQISQIVKPPAGSGE